MPTITAKIVRSDAYAMLLDDGSQRHLVARSTITQQNGNRFTIPHWPPRFVTEHSRPKQTPPKGHKRGSWERANFVPDTPDDKPLSNGTTITAYLENETDAAWLVVDDQSRRVWLPKSVAHRTDETTFTMPEWLALQKGLL
jgi:hypothetical protein